MRRDAFLLVWRGLSESTRGGWSESDLGRRQDSRFKNSDIILRDNFVQQRDLLTLINLCQACEGFFSAGVTGVKHDVDRINQVIENQAQAGLGADYSRIVELVPVIARDMRHRGAKRPVNVGLERRFLRAQPAPQRRERPRTVASEWVLFLNSDYHGGELVFPTRMRCIAPRAGTIVRWPAGIPHAIAPSVDGYQFTLSGRWES